MIKVARFLEIGVVLDYGSFQGFRDAFDPAEILWDTDPGPIMERARATETGTHARPWFPRDERVLTMQLEGRERSLSGASGISCVRVRRNRLCTDPFSMLRGSRWKGMACVRCDV